MATIKQQAYEELVIQENETLTTALVRLNEETRQEHEVKFVEVQQVIPYNDKFTVIFNLYK
ncbi:hypothetical protein [Bacillus sp. CH_442]|uniref:hypothetical protein n=1 Tax=Bacillus sp. CH_442 TaxID=2978217 RepID=UPI0030F992D7|nr:hypothetical protein [Bacillus thuringiensis]